MTCAGKSSALKELVSKFGYNPIITYTTRPIRSEEIEGVDYHFLAPEAFDILEESDFFAETTSYNVAYGEIWKYGTSVQSLKEAPSDAVIVLNPYGLQKVISLLGKENVCVCYITVNKETIVQRSANRGDDKEESARRYEADQKDFEDVSAYADIFIPNNLEEDFDKLVSDIDMYYQIYKAGKVGDKSDEYNE